MLCACLYGIDFSLSLFARISVKCAQCVSVCHSWLKATVVHSKQTKGGRKENFFNLIRAILSVFFISEKNTRTPTNISDAHNLYVSLVKINWWKKIQLAKTPSQSKTFAHNFTVSIVAFRSNSHEQRGHRSFRPFCTFQFQLVPLIDKLKIYHSIASKCAN